MPVNQTTHLGMPQGYETIDAEFRDYPGTANYNPYINIDPTYNDIDFFVITGNFGIYLNNVLKPELSLDHCTAYFIQSAFNSVPINLSTNKDLNDNSLSSFLSYYVTGSKMNDFNEYSQKFVPSELTYLKLKSTYKIPTTAIHYFIPNRLNSGNKINILAAENVTNFVITSSTGFTVLSCGDYEFFIGRYKDRELMVNVRSEYAGTSANLPPVSSWRLPLSSHFTIPAINTNEIYIFRYVTNFFVLCSAYITLERY